MNLGDGGRGERGRNVLERGRLFTQCLGQKTGDKLFIERGQRVLKGGEIGGDFKPDDVAASGEDLAELDVNRAEPGQGIGQPRDAAGLAHVSLLDQPGDADHKLG